MTTFIESKCGNCKLCSLITPSYDFERHIEVDARCNSEEGPSLAINSKNTPQENFMISDMKKEARKRVANGSSCFTPKE
jgi:hypothetical protein